MYYNIVILKYYNITILQYHIYYTIPNNDVLSFKYFNITWKARSIFPYTTRAAMLANWEEGSVRVRILPREYTDPYTP